MSVPASRRGFLRGLTMLPLIGGGVTLIGSPSAVAEPCTETTLLRYCAFLAHEHRAAIEERYIQTAEREVAERIAAGREVDPDYLSEVRVRARKYAPMHWFPEAPVIETIVERAAPSTRAALVLSAVGCDWRRSIP